MAPDPDTILKGFLENNNSVIFAVDLNYHYIAFNEKFRSMMKKTYSADIKQGMNALHCLFPENERKKAKQALDRAFKGESFVHVQEFGEKQLCRITSYYPMINEGEIFGAAAVITDSSECVCTENPKEEYVRKLENVIYKTSHELRQPIAQILGLVQIVSFEKNSPEEVMNILKLFKVAATRLDQFTIEMTKFIYSSIKNKKPEKNFYEMEKLIETL